PRSPKGPGAVCVRESGRRAPPRPPRPPGRGRRSHFHKGRSPVPPPRTPKTRTLVPRPSFPRATAGAGPDASERQPRAASFKLDLLIGRGVADQPVAQCPGFEEVGVGGHDHGVAAASRIAAFQGGVPPQPVEDLPHVARNQGSQRDASTIKNAVPSLRRGDARDWSAMAAVGGVGSTTILTVCTPGGSYSRTTSSPCLALERQWIRRSESPGRY